jgi:hypothetical protein
MRHLPTIEAGLWFRSIPNMCGGGTGAGGRSAPEEVGRVEPFQRVARELANGPLRLLHSLMGLRAFGRFSNSTFKAIRRERLGNDQTGSRPFGADEFWGTGHENHTGVDAFQYFIHSDDARGPVAQFNIRYYYARLCFDSECERFVVRPRRTDRLVTEVVEGERYVSGNNCLVLDYQDWDPCEISSRTVGRKYSRR